jgi:predicted DNA-binding antitoxin AbrB/MazE fold protein
MPTIMPEGEKVRQAVKFISAERVEDEKKSIRKLIQKASLKFNLSPKEEQDLVNFYRDR